MWCIRAHRTSSGPASSLRPHYLSSLAYITPGFSLDSPTWYYAYMTLFWSTFCMSQVDYFSSMCIGLTSSSCKKHSSSNSSHIIFIILLISSPLSLMTCSSSSHYVQINNLLSFSISVSTLLSSPASQHHRSLTCSIASASCDAFTQQHMYSDHFRLFYSNLWCHHRPISDPVLSRRAIAATPLTPSTSFLSDENINMNTPQPGSQSDEG